MTSGICRHRCARAVSLARASERSGTTIFAKMRGQKLGGTHKLPVTTGGRNEKWSRVLLYVVAEGRSLPSSDDSVGVRVWTCKTDREVATAASKSSVPASRRSTATGASSRDGASGAGSSVSSNEMAVIHAEDQATDNQILRDSTDSRLAASLDPLIADAAAQSPPSTRASPARLQNTPAVASQRSRRSTRTARGGRERTSPRFNNAGKGKSPAHT